jgi:hypothetical protein
MKSKMIMLSATAYSVQDRVTNQTNEGMTLFFYPAENLNPTENQMARMTDRGAKPMKVSAPLAVENKIQSVPGLYECTMQMKTGTDGKAMLTVTDFEFVSSLVTEVGPGSFEAVDKPKQTAAGASQPK